MNKLKRRTRMGLEIQHSLFLFFVFCFFFFALPALNLNIFGIVSFNLHNFLSWPCYPSDGITEAEESK